MFFKVKICCAGFSCYSVLCEDCDNPPCVFLVPSVVWVLLLLCAVRGSSYFRSAMFCRGAFPSYSNNCCVKNSCAIFCHPTSVDQSAVVRCRVLSRRNSPMDVFAVLIVALNQHVVRFLGRRYRSAIRCVAVAAGPNGTTPVPSPPPFGLSPSFRPGATLPR